MSYHILHENIYKPQSCLLYIFCIPELVDMYIYIYMHVLINILLKVFSSEICIYVLVRAVKSGVLLGGSKWCPNQTISIYTDVQHIYETCLLAEFKWFELTEHAEWSTGPVLHIWHISHCLYERLFAETAHILRGCSIYAKDKKICNKLKNKNPARSEVTSRQRYKRKCVEGGRRANIWSKLRGTSACNASHLHPDPAAWQQPPPIIYIKFFMYSSWSVLCQE